MKEKDRQTSNVFLMLVETLIMVTMLMYKIQQMGLHNAFKILPHLHQLLKLFLIANLIMFLKQQLMEQDMQSQMIEQHLKVIAMNVKKDMLNKELIIR